MILHTQKKDDIEYVLQFIDNIICILKDQKSERDLADMIKFLHKKWWRNQMHYINLVVKMNNNNNKNHIILIEKEVMYGNLQD